LVSFLACVVLVTTEYKRERDREKDREQERERVSKEEKRRERRSSTFSLNRVSKPPRERGSPIKILRWFEVS
jgi:hypothetical protein